MPSPAELPHRSRPWWREPLPPDGSEGSEGSQDRVRTSAVAAPAFAEPAVAEPAVAEPAVAEPAGNEPVHPAGPDPARTGITPPWETAGPDDATAVMAPVADPTMELPPVPPDPSGFVTSGRPRPRGAPPRGAPAPGSRSSTPGVPASGPKSPLPPRSASLAPPPLRAASADRRPAAAPATADLDAPESGVATGPSSGRSGAAAWLRQLSPAGLRLSPTGLTRDRRSTLVAVGGAGLALLLVIAGAGLLVSRLRNQPPATGTFRAATAIDLGTVKGSASSVQRPDGGITYTVGNTLDGDPSTAWNSDGARDGRGPGIVLSYRFATQVDLSMITLRNGYQKMRTKGADLWERNERVKRLLVITDSGQWTWDLKDAKDPQTLTQKFGRTTSVKLKIVSVYPSTRYTDVAISEIAFSGVPVS